MICSELSPSCQISNLPKTEKNRCKTKFKDILSLPSSNTLQSPSKPTPPPPLCCSFPHCFILVSPGRPPLRLPTFPPHLLSFLLFFSFSLIDLTLSSHSRHPSSYLLPTISSIMLSWLSSSSRPCSPLILGSLLHSIDSVSLSFSSMFLPESTFPLLFFTLSFRLFSLDVSSSHSFLTHPTAI